ncbi:hypothetical protein WMF20_29545 [Sorangium sp. So ce834]|uniref:hypothetical protein n=1 Tax=Sorangium sp. So ce834 TaxID=3133321 RepID=UPI003F5EA4BD
MDATPLLKGDVAEASRISADAAGASPTRVASDEQDRARRGSEHRSVDAVRADTGAAPLHARDVLLSRESIAVDLRGHERVAQPLQGHRGLADYDDLNDP